LAPGLATPRRGRRRRIRLLGDRRPGQGGRARFLRRPRGGWPAGLALLRSDREGQPRSLRVPDVDALAVVNVDDRHPVAVDKGAIQRTVVDCQPPALIEPEYQVRAGDPRIGNAQVGVQVTADDHLVACGEGTLGPVVSDCQDRRGGSTHYSSIGPRLEWAPWDSPVTCLYFGLATHSCFIACCDVSPTEIRHDSNVRGVKRELKEAVFGRAERTSVPARGTEIKQRAPIPMQTPRVFRPMSGSGDTRR
jgi:hypothetical protein